MALNDFAALSENLAQLWLQIGLRTFSLFIETTLPKSSLWNRRYVFSTKLLLLTLSRDMSWKMRVTRRECLPTDCCIITAGGLKQGEVVKCISGSVVSNVEELYCTHEEADTRIILHATKPCEKSYTCYHSV